MGQIVHMDGLEQRETVVRQVEDLAREDVRDEVGPAAAQIVQGEQVAAPRDVAGADHRGGESVLPEKLQGLIVHDVNTE